MREIFWCKAGDAAFLPFLSCVSKSRTYCEQEKKSVQRNDGQKSSNESSNEPFSSSKSVLFFEEEAISPPPVDCVYNLSSLIDNSTMAVEFFHNQYNAIAIMHIY